MAEDEKEAYRVEIDVSGCPKCGHGAYWDVIGPDDVALATSYADKEDAIEIAEILNMAYEAGRKSNG
jgi:hypothetical protein